MGERNSKLRGILDRDHALGGGDERRKRREGGGLAAPGAADDEDVPTRDHAEAHEFEHLLGQAPERNEIAAAEYPLAEPANGQDGPLKAERRDDRVDP